MGEAAGVGSRRLAGCASVVTVSGRLEPLAVNARCSADTLQTQPGC